MQKVFADIGSYMVDVFHKAFAVVLEIINNQFIAPLSKLLVFPSLEEFGNKIQGLSSNLTDYSRNLNSAVPKFATKSVDALIPKLKELGDAQKQAVKDNVRVSAAYPTEL